ncbi:MAG: hypothetical protein IT364_08725 [Candidatus Hydrogenedentes bacterium]|nr:hypothetical protein [Candidatus Hydrogenedentota bacterium]
MVLPSPSHGTALAGNPLGSSSLVLPHPVLMNKRNYPARAEVPDVLWGLLLLAGSIGLLWSRRFRLRKAWKDGVAALERGDFPAAENSLRKCLRQAPSWVPPRRLLGRTLVALRRFDEAERELRLTAQFEPRTAEVHLELAVFLSNCPPIRLDEALDSLRTAVNLAPALSEEARRMPLLAPLREHPGFLEAVSAAGPADKA